MNSELQVDALEALSFDNRFVRELPADSEQLNQRRQVSGACYSFVAPTKVAKPELVAYSKEVAAQLGISEALCESTLFTEVFAGNKLLEDMQPFAMCYGGHQFGNWAGQLGDGRAINLGELLNQQGERYTLQLKGAGPTPYSRTADGLAVLRSSVREFLCSEAMHHLGVPTTRALSLILTGEEVVRDMFYDGHPKAEPGAVVCRVAPSFLRFGSFQLFSANGEIDELKQLVDYNIRTDFAHLGEPSKQTYLAWLEEICRRTAEMIVHWQHVGFVHGVMNTDNMSILGLTIDYGPYGWLENYDPNWTPNTTDAQGRRYRYGHQPQIAMWNLIQLANAIYPLIDEVEPLEKALEVYAQTFQQGYQEMMAAKLGFFSFEEETDKALIDDLMENLKMVETDMTIFYRQLAALESNNENLEQVSNEDLMTPLMQAYYLPEQLTDEYKSSIGDWLRAYVSRLQKDARPASERRLAMNKVNPKYVLRNYLAQLAIDKSEQGDHSMVNELLEVLRRPYDEQPEREAEYYQRRPDWARQRAGCSMLSCSS
jgi:serine/tyrosine/threonine adenylyltransferase